MPLVPTRRDALAKIAGAACALATAPARAAPKQVRVGVLSVLSDIGVFMALDKGHFREQNLEIELINFNAAPQIVPPLSTNQVQVSGLSSSPALFNAIERGIGLRFVADKGRVTKSASWSALIVRSDLADKVQTYADLRKLKIAVPAKASNYVQLVEALRLGGLTLDDVEIIFLPFPDMVAALGNKAIDAAIVAEPFVAIATQRKVARRWRGIDEFLPFAPQNGMIAYSEQFMAQDPDGARRWMVAYLRGVRDYLRMMQDAAGRDRVFDVIQRYTDLKSRDIFDRTQPIGFDPDGQLERASIAYDQTWYFKLGLQASVIDVDRSIEPSFAMLAAKELGL